MIDSRNKISFYTSFNPKKYGDQYKTWRKYAHAIYAVQDPKDVKINVDCSIILNNAVDFHGKNLQKLTDITKIARLMEGAEKFVIINSDIEIYFSSDRWNKICEIANDALVTGYRFDYALHKNNNKKHKYGLDFFIINNKIKIPKDCPFLLGACAWDWWMIELCKIQNVPVYSLSEQSILHKEHERNWTDEMFLDCQKWFDQFSKTNKKDLANYILDLV